MKEFKSLPGFTKSKIEGRAVTGLFSILGNRDSAGDRMMPGSFAKTFSEGRKRFRHLWQHDFSSPPVAAIKDLYEIGKSDLPEQVLEFAPDAVGGAVVVREYLDTARGNEILEGLKTGAIDEMSFAFDSVKADFAEEPINGEKFNTRYVREVKLWETSDVLWGANPATLSARSLDAKALIESLKELMTEIKAGRRNASVDQARVQEVHDLAVELGAMCGAEEEEPKTVIDPALILKEADAILAGLSLANFDFAA